MSRFNLPSSETTNLFKKRTELENFEKLLHAIDRERTSLFRDLDRLEELYIIQNVHKFKNRDFRIHLLTHSFGSSRFYNFCSSLGFTTVSKTAPEKEKKDLVEKIGSFEWGDNAQTRAFVSAFELDENIIPHQIELIESLEMLEKPKSTYNQLFNYQFEICEEAKKIILDQQAGRVIVQIPTGGGKTKIAMELVTDFFNANQDATVIWVAETKELLEQAIKEFKKIWMFRGTSSLTINRLWEKHTLNPEMSGPRLIVAGLSKLISFFKKNQKLKADFIIFDEAHHAPAEKYSEVLLHLGIIGQTKILGLTATPGRGERDETKDLAELFNDQPPIQINTHDPRLGPIGFLQKRGVLARLNIGDDKIIRIPKIDVAFSKTEINKLLKSSEYNDKNLLIKIGQSHIRNLIIFRKLLELVKEKRRLLYFAPSKEQAKIMYLLLANFDVKAGLILGETSPEYRDELISKFQRKEINCLLNYGVLVAGFDVPSIDTIFIGRPTKSANTLFQMIGRGMRGPIVKDGTAFCDVYHVQDKFLEQFQDFEALYASYGNYYNHE